MSTQHHIRVTADGPKVVWVLDGKRLLEVPWKAALELSNAMRTQVRAARAYGETGAVSPEPEITVACAGWSLAVRQVGNMVVFIGNGRLLFDMPARVAEQLWRGTLVHARKCEEMAEADRIARDAAILHRSGAFFGLTDNPLIKAEAAKEAVHNRDLRRFIPNSIQSAEVIGAPAVYHGSPPPDQRLRRLMSRMAPADQRNLLQKLSGSPRENVQ